MPIAFEYDDLRYLLAVAETGTTLAASRQLGVSQSTVSRRVAALESVLGIELFDKRRTGYALTATAEALLEPARGVRSAIEAFSSAVEGRSREISGTVRFTTNEVLAGILLPELIPRMREAYPGIRVEVDTSATMRDLARGEADVALRSGPAPTQAGLFGVKMGEDRWSLCCSRSYAEAHGYPRSLEELGRHALIGLDPSFSRRREFDWARRHFPPGSIVVEQNSVPASFASVRSGVGVGFYSEFLVMSDPEVIRCFRPDLPSTLEVWLVTHERLKDVPRVRALMDTVKSLVKTYARRVMDN